jgi:xeroderma pigmentosum group C-complementing protein
MLAEAARAEKQAASSSNPRASKRRKIDSIDEEPSPKIGLDFDLFGPGSDDNIAADQSVTAVFDDNKPPTEKLQQIVYDEFEGSDDSEVEVEFEDVDLEAQALPEENDDDDRAANPQQQRPALELDLSTTNLDTPKRAAATRRKPVGPGERKLRLEVHKAHLVCLLAHLDCRNRWCEAESVQSVLKPLIPRKVTALLHVDESQPQYQRSHSFTKGIEEVCSIWRLQWQITARGMRRAHWKDDVDALKESDDMEDLIDFTDFQAAAKSTSGSRDLAAQLFCVLLRSVAVDTRLVCSLQALPFSGVAKGQTPEKSKPQYYHAPAQNYSASPTTGALPSERTTLKKKKIVESPFPIFWVEVYSPSTATWIPLDPIVRNTINKPKTGFEPPAADQLNSMTYVVAFEDDGSAKDVTRRYTQWYNAKTRKLRVESTKGGREWWQRTIKTFEKPFAEDRDDIEDALLSKRAESEPMPRNVQDFKGHPVYVLERHLRMNEVIHPKHEVGKVSTGPSKNAKLESVYRRRDVHLCRSADAWYRRGRDVNEGEQPLQRVVSKRRRDQAAVLGEDLDEDDEGNEGTALYAEYQTSLYIPPPVVDGQIPKNAYGNLDVYVPTMIPAGAVHIRHPLAAEAALALDVDYTDAVTGFEFKGRQGTAVVDGVVVSADTTNAMRHVIEGLESQASDEAEEARSRIILGVWKRWLTALRVRERVHQQYGDNEERSQTSAAGDDEDDDEDDETYEDDPADHGGGFMHEAAEPDQPSAKQSATDTEAALAKLKPIEQLLPPEVVHQDVVVVRSPNKLPRPAKQEDGKQQKGSSLVRAGDEEGGRGGFVPEEKDDTEGGGGFLPEDDDDDAGGGGFIPEAEDAYEGKGNAMTGMDVDVDIDEVRGGGGFLPEDAEEGQGDESGPAPSFHEEDLPTGGSKSNHPDTTAGGFLPEDSPTMIETAETDRPKGGFLPEDSPTMIETAETDRPKGTSTSTLDQHQPRTHAIPANAVAEAAKHSPTAAVAADEPGPGAVAVTPSDPDPDPDTPQSSETSLLSHDPEEEDAEPEWLLSSLGEI